MQFSVEADLLSVEISGLCFPSTVYYCLFPWDKFSGYSTWKLSASCLWFSAGHSSAVPVSLLSFWSCRCLRIFERLWVNAIKLSVGLSSCRTYDIVIMLWWFSTRVYYLYCCLNHWLIPSEADPAWTLYKKMILATEWEKLSSRLWFHLTKDWCFAFVFKHVWRTSLRSYSQALGAEQKNGLRIRYK